MDASCTSLKSHLIKQEIKLSGGEAVSYIMTNVNNELALQGPFSPDDVKKSKNGDGKFSYDIYFGKNGTHIFKIELPIGGVYTLMVVQSNTGEFESKLVQITEPNSIHMLWLLPQYIVITAGEIMFSITGLAFSFTQAPSSMKSVMQAS